MKRENIIKSSIVVVFLLFASYTTNAAVQSSPDDNMIVEQFNGIIFYVGGSGPGNYSTIQGAINDAGNGAIFLLNNAIYINLFYNFYSLFLFYSHHFVVNPVDFSQFFFQIFLKKKSQR